MRSLLILALLTTTAQALPPAPPFTPTMQPDIEYNKEGRYFELRHSMGGLLATFDHRFKTIELTDIPVHVTDICASACTFILRNSKACAERGALFGFHQALKPSTKNPGYYEYAENSTNYIWSTYPEVVKTKLGKLTPQMVWVKGYEIMPACEPPIKPTTCLHKMLGSPLPC